MTRCHHCGATWSGTKLEHCMAPACPLARFWSKVIFAPSGHWRWVGAFNSNGYGRLYGDGEPGEPKVMYAHRFSYKKLVGPIPEGMVIDHLCREKACVNPMHLEPVTHTVNMNRGFGRAAKALLKTCPWGHDYTPENTFLSSTGGRACRTCRRAGAKRERVR